MKMIHFQLLLKILLCSLICGKTQTVISQNQHTCGVYVKPKKKNESNFKSTVIDRFGNMYSINDRTSNGKASEKVLACGVNSIFEINLVGSFTADEEATICNVFSYLASDVIMSLPSGGLKAKIEVKKTDEGLPSGTYGTGSAYYNDFGCGVQNSLVWERMVAGISYGPPISPNGNDGYILIRDNVDWFTYPTQQGSPVCPQVDLYTVILHEALHVLGFASNISASGLPDNGLDFYFPWDQFVYASNGYLLENIGEVNGCCDNYNYVGPTPPSSLFTGNCGNLSFKQGALNVPINNTTVGSVYNSLSHLCTNSYVMYPFLDCGEDRRIVTSDEKEILCKLGIRNCSPNTNCRIVAMNDNNVTLEYVTGNSGYYRVKTSDLLMNDKIPTGVNPSDIKVSFISGCEDDLVLHAYVSPGLNPEYINFPINTPGQYILCYSISLDNGLSCENECDQAKFSFTIPYQFDALPSYTQTSCGGEYFPEGSFNNFYPFIGSSAYFDRLGIPFCFMNQSVIQNTPDIYFIGGMDKCIGIGHNYDSEREAIYFPIEPGIPPGCSAVITFDGVSLNIQTTSEIFIFGSVENPCYSNNTLPDCYSTPNNCNMGGYYILNTNEDPILITNILNNPLYDNGQGGCQSGQPVYSTDGEWPLPTNFQNAPPYICKFPAISGAFNNYSANWTNNTGETIHFVSFAVNAHELNKASYAVLDNISVHVVCNNEITITPTIINSSICNDGLVQIDYEICLESATAGTFDFQPSIEPAGLNYSYLGDFANPPISVTLQPNECKTVSLFIDLHPSSVSVTQLDVQLDLLTDATCVEGNEKVIVEIDNSVYEDADAGFTYDDAGCEVTFTADELTGYHEWDFGDGSFGEGNITTHTFQGNGPYTIKHTVSNGCDTKTEDLTFSLSCDVPVSCDCPVNSITIGESGQTKNLLDYITFGQLPANPTGPIDVIMLGTINVNTDYVFPDGSNICMGSGAKIELSPWQGKLTLIGTHVRGCDAMWRGIEIHNGTTLTTQKSATRRTIIEDAENAVTVNSSGSIYLSGTDFNRDYVGVTAWGSFISNITDCVFSCVDCENIGFKPPYPGQANIPIQKTRAGIIMGPGGFEQIGKLGEPANIFTGVGTGIAFYQISLSVVNSQFINIVDDGVYGVEEGVGIYGDGNNQPYFFRQGSSELCNIPDPQVTFSNCTTGMYFNGMNVGANKNVMTGVDNGIVVENSPTRRIRICSNDITAHRTGIKLYNNDNAQFVRVESNTINMVQPVGVVNLMTAIEVKENGGVQNDALISNNTDINLTDGRNGISLDNCNGYVLSSNFVHATAPQTDTYFGIKLNNCKEMTLYCNQVDGNYNGFNSNSGTSGSTGMRVTASPDVTYNCNKFGDTRNGVQFDMGCDGSRILGTSFNNHYFGLHYFATGKTGRQPDNPNTQLRNGNTWTNIGALTANGARHESQVLDFRNLSRYTVSSGPGTNKYPMNPSPSDWIIVSGGNDFLCNTMMGNCPTVIDHDGDKLRSSDESIALGQVQPGIFNAETQWMSDFYLYQKLYEHPELIAPGSIYQTFYTAKSSTAIGAFAPIRKAINGLFVLNTEDNNKLNGYQLFMDENIGEIATIDEQLPTATGNTQQQLLAQRAVAVQNLEEVTNDIDNLMGNIAATRYSTADDLLTLNEGINVSTVYEQNEQTVNTIYLNTIAKDNYSLKEGQKAELQAIANQCPYAGGTAVFRARNLLATLNGPTDYDDEALCQPQQFGGNPPSLAIAAPTGAKVYPNPANDRFNVELDGALASDGQLVLYNAFGKEVLVQKLQAETTTFGFDVDTLPSGIYWLDISEGKKSVFATRLVLIK